MLPTEDEYPSIEVLPMDAGVVQAWTQALTATVAIKGGGGKASKTETAITATVALTGGGGQALKTETAITASVVLGLGSYP